MSRLILPALLEWNEVKVKANNVLRRKLPITFETFKPIDIQNSNNRLWPWVLPNGSINFIDYPVDKRIKCVMKNIYKCQTMKWKREIAWIASPVKQVRIYCLCQRIPTRNCIIGVKSSCDDLFRRNHHTPNKSIFKALGITPIKTSAKREQLLQQ